MKLYCNEVKKLLPLYMDNMTNQMETEAISAHLKTCAECRLELEFLQSIQETAHNFPEIKVSDNFNSSLHAKLVAVKNENRSQVLSRIKKTATLTASAVAVIAISVISLGVLKEKEIHEDFYPTETSAPVIFVDESPDDTTKGSETEDKTKTLKDISNSVSENTQKTDVTKKTDVTDKKEKKETSDKTAEIKKKENPAVSAPNADNKQKETAKHSLPKQEAKISNPAGASQTPPSDKDANSPNMISLLSEDSDQAPAFSGENTPKTRSTFATPGGGSGGGSAKNTEENANDASAENKSSKTNYVAPKIKVTASVSVDSENTETAKEILSQYKNSDGVYELSNSEFNQVMNELNALDASINVSGEDKTPHYSALSEQLTQATDNTATAIQDEMNQIDNETEKKYIELN